jgi:hypothetical protein
MTTRFRSLYPALLAAIDMAIGGGLLYAQTASPLGFLMIGVGIVLGSHVAFTVLGQTSSVFRRVGATNS